MTSAASSPFVPVSVAAYAADAPRVRIYVWISRYNLPTQRDKSGRLLVDLAAVMRTEAATRPERERRLSRERV